MACNTCTNNDVVAFLYTSSPCPDCGCTSSPSSCSTPLDSSKVVYTGPKLLCSNIDSGLTVEEVLQGLDTKMCQMAGVDFSGFNTQCILNPDNSNISNQQEFVEGVTDYLCNLQTTYTTFVNEYNTFVTEITQVVEGNNTVGITSCAGVGIIPADTNAQAFTKVSDAICSIQTNLNISSVNWNQYGFTVGSVPTTITAMANKLIQYIGETKNSIPSATTIPTFNNVSSCLPGTLTTADTLANTVEKIKTKLCSIDYDLSGLTLGCISEASPNIPSLLQAIITRISNMQLYQFDSGDFTLGQIDPLDACAGQTISIASSAIDNKVASDSADTAPGYLFNKLQAGTAISLDHTTTPGKVIIASSALGDHKVLVNGSDVAPDYLDTKIDGAVDTTGSITLAATTNGGNSKVVVTPTIDLDALQAALLNFITGNTAATSAWQSFLCSLDCTGSSSAQFTIEASGKQFQFTADQNAPTVIWYNTGAASLTGTLNSGTYSITSVATNPQVTLYFQNNGVAPVNISVVSKDLSGVVVPSSTTWTTAVVAGGAVSNATFNLGIGATAYVVHVTVT